MQSTHGDLLTYKRNVHSQNGEDGIIDQIFSVIGPGQKVCCEFGAWDGVFLSNCRNLILQGWRAMMIEGDRLRYQQLLANYGENPRVKCLNVFVDDAKNSIDNLARQCGFPELDFLSIDIDGLDYELFAGLSSRPRVICVEVSAGHDPEASQRIPPELSRDNVGQPLALFVKTGEEMGYSLVCYSGNAFFVRRDVAQQFGLAPLSPAEAYANFIKHLEQSGREWLFLVNRGVVNPFRKHHNPHLTAEKLGISRVRAAWLPIGYRLDQTLGAVKSVASRILRRKASK